MNKLESNILSRLMGPGDMDPVDVYKRASFGNTEWLNAMVSHHWMPAWPVLRNAGYSNQLMPCFVLPIEDSLESILETMKRCGIIFKLGGSTGINISPLRAKGATLSTGGVASGPVAFMQLFDAEAQVITQGGKRRGGFMIVLNANHPDVKEFIACKNVEGTFPNMNISVLIDNRNLVDSWKGEIITAIAESIWKTGEPGVLFGEMITPYDCVNLCGEVPLPSWGVCNLGSVNLAACVQKGSINLEVLETYTMELGGYLDFLIDKNVYPFAEMEDEEKRSRRIGVGVMGYHEAISLHDVKYENSATIAESLASVMAKTLKEMLPNAAQHMSIAPTGTIAMLCGTTFGIEPMYRTDYETFSPQGSVSVKFDIKDKCADEIPWRVHLEIQKSWQKFVDGAISKTILFPHNSTAQDIAECIHEAERTKCIKGLTIYRLGSRKHEAMTAKPVITDGRTMRVQTGWGKLFVTLNTYQDRWFETFFTIGRSGSLLQSFTEAIGRLCSLSLQHHIPVGEIIDQLKGIRSPTPSFDPKLGHIESVPDACAKVLEYLSSTYVEHHNFGECPKCFNETTVSEGCEMCLNCGWSRCNA